MLERLKQEVYEANMNLKNYNLVVFTWGNVSAIDRESGLIAIKPSGISYENLTVDDIVIVNLEGKVIDGDLKPSSDTLTHLILYKAFKNISSVVHTHSEWATSFAQANKSITPYGTTHADYFRGEIPCTRKMFDAEIINDYEMNTGHVIVETFKDINPLEVPSVLVCEHGPFSWGTSATNAVHNAVVLEEIAKIAYKTEILGHNTPIESILLNKHFHRKHGKNAYYGQVNIED